MTDDEQPRWPKILLIGCVIAAIVGAGWAAKPVYRNWKKHRHVSQAYAYLAKFDLRNAALSARLALSIDALDIRATQVMAEITARLRSPELVTWRQRIVDIEPDNVTNRIALAEAALMFGDIARAEQSLVKIPETNRNSVAFHSAAALVLAGQKKLSDALARFELALKIDPANQMLQLNRAVILLQATDTNIAASALRTIKDCATNAMLRPMALRLMTETHLRAADFNSAIGTARELATSTNSAPGERTLLLTALFAAHSSEYAAELLAMQEGAVAAGQEPVRSLAMWLIGTGQTDEASRWLSSLPKDLQSQQSVSMALADLHMSRANWVELEKVVSKAKWGEADFLRRAILSRACLEQNQQMAASAAWLEAIRAAGANPKRLGILAHQAEGWRWEREQEELLWTLMERHPAERWASAELAKLVTESRSTTKLNRLSGILLSQLPENHPDLIFTKNNFAATSLLLNQQMSRANEIARDLFTRYPSNEVLASTYAYSLFIQGKREDAIKAFAAVKPEALENPSVALYYGVILGKSSPIEAAKYLDLAAKGDLLPEEKTLLTEARDKLK